MRQRDFIAARGGTMAPPPMVHAPRRRGIVMRALITAWLTVAATPGWTAEASIADGHTLIVDGVTYRLDGIEAPQTDQTCIDEKGAAWTCGVAARDRLQEHVGKRDVRCTDRGADSVFRKKRIGECFVAGEATSLNQWMVQQGWALNADRSAKGPLQGRPGQCKRPAQRTLEGLLRIARGPAKVHDQHVGHAGRRLPRAEQLADPQNAVSGKPRHAGRMRDQRKDRAALTGRRLSWHLSSAKLRELCPYKTGAAVVLFGTGSPGCGLPQVVHLLNGPRSAVVEVLVRAQSDCSSA